MPHRPDDLSDHSHRQVIGYIGLFLPLILVLLAGLLPTEGLPRWGLLDSVSAYYYTGAISAFVGMLVVLALFLLTYRGYRNQFGRADRTAAIIGSIAAILVAVFPTEAPEGVSEPSWWTPLMGIVHYLAAATLFVVFMVFSFWLFRKTHDDHPPADKRWRNMVYLACGLVMAVSTVWTAIAGINGAPMFLPESIALTAFAVSWLVKGYAFTTLKHAVTSNGRG